MGKWWWRGATHLIGQPGPFLPLLPPALVGGSTPRPAQFLGGAMRVGGTGSGLLGLPTKKLVPRRSRHAGHENRTVAEQCTGRGSQVSDNSMYVLQYQTIIAALLVLRPFLAGLCRAIPPFGCTRY